MGIYSLIHIILVGQKNFFQEFVDAMAQALLVKGHKDIKIFFYRRKLIEQGTQNIKFSPDFNVICTPQNIEQMYVLPNNGSENVWIQTEQIPKPTKYKRWSRVITLFKDLENDHRVYFPCGYSSTFTGKPMDGSPYHKYFSFGAVTPWRTSTAKNIGVHHERECHGSGRDTLIRKADINVNLKAFNRDYFFAPLHALHVICNGKILFQQRCQGDWSLYKPYVIEFGGKGNFIKLTNEWMMDKTKMVAHGKAMRTKLMKELDFTEQFLHCLKGVL